jgi:hypothetical protein
MAAVTRHGCCRGKDSEGWCVTRMVRRREQVPPPRPSAANGCPLDSSSGEWLGSEEVEGTGSSSRPGAQVATPTQRESEASRRTVEAPWRGCGRGGVRGSGPTAQPETWRTPWSAAGCNKPARHCAEKTVVAERNGKDGTSTGLGSPEPKESGTRFRVTGAGSGRAELMSMEGRSLDNPKRGV